MLPVLVVNAGSTSLKLELVSGNDKSEVLSSLDEARGRATEAMRAFLARVPALDGASVAVFDTRLPARWVKIFGFAAGKIADKLQALGATLAAEPEGLVVEGKEGPLAEGELERAAAWARSLPASSTG